MRTARWWVCGLWIVAGLMLAAGGWQAGSGNSVDPDIVEEVSYAPHTGLLTVVFRDGSTVRFRDVQPTQAEELMGRQDRAGYLYREILAECGMEFVLR